MGLNYLMDTNVNKRLEPTNLANRNAISGEIISEVLGVNLDYLVGENINSFDKKNIKQLQDIENLDTDTKENIHFVIDNIIQNASAKKAFAS